MNRISFLNRGYAFKGLLAVFEEGLRTRMHCIHVQLYVYSVDIISFQAVKGLCPHLMWQK